MVGAAVVALWLVTTGAHAQYLPGCQQGGGPLLCTPIRDNGWSYNIGWDGPPFLVVPAHTVEVPDLASALSGFMQEYNSLSQAFCAAAGCEPNLIVGSSCAAPPTQVFNAVGGPPEQSGYWIQPCSCAFNFQGGVSQDFWGAFGRTRPYCGPNAFLRRSNPSSTCGGEPYACAQLSPKDLGPPACEAATGNPINAATGNKYESEVDYQGPGSFPLVFVRTYNSFDVGLGGAAGTYWRTNFQRAIEFWGAGSVPMALAYRPDGRVIAFKLISGAFVADPDIPDRLLRDVDEAGNVTGWRYVDAADVTEEYTATGRLAKLTDRSGLALTLAYDGNGNLAGVADSFGRSLGFSYDGLKRVTAMTDPAGASYTYGYDAKNRLVRVTYPDGFSKQYHYDEQAYTANAPQPHALTGISDENGNRFAIFRYDASGKAIATAHLAAPGVEVQTFSITYGSSSFVTDPKGTTRALSFQTLFESNKCTGSTQPSPYGGGNRKQITYDAASGWANSVVDFNDVTTAMVRADPYGRADLETQRREALGRPEMRLVTTQWHPTFRLPTQFTEPAPGGTRTTTLTYDGSGNLLQKAIVAPRNDGTSGTVTRSWSWTYGSLGRRLTATDPNNRVTTYAHYDDSDVDVGKRGNLRSITNPLGHVTQITAYDAHGRPVTTIDANGLTTALTYDARGRVTDQVVGGEHTTFVYDGVGQLTGVVLPDSSTLTYTYDGAHRLTRVQDGLGNRITYALDAAGNRIQEDVYDVGGTLARTRSRVFDGLGRLAQEVGAEAQATAYGYDGNGNATTIAAPMARTTTNSFDALNRLAAVLDPAGGVTQYAYDADGRLTRVTDARGLATVYTYDGLGNLREQTSPDSGITASTFDAAGNVLTRADARGATASYTVDALDRVTSVVYAKAGTPSETHIYSYDSGTNGKGRLTQLADPAATTTWTYTPHGRVSGKTQTAGGVTRAVAYAYNAAGQLVILTTPSGQQIGYGYLNDRVVSITVNGVPLASGIVTTPFGPAGAWQWGNGLFTFRDYDRDGRLSRWTFRNGADVVRNDLVFDAASRITGVADPVSPARSGAFQYDVLDRLTVAQQGSPVIRTLQYGYDASGNRTGVNADGLAANLTYDSASNRLQSVVGVASTAYYNGLPSVNFVYSNANRLVGIDSGGTLATYAVNGLGQRVRKMAGGATIQFVYDDRGQLLGEYDATGNLIQETVWLDGLPIATLRPTGTGAPTPVAIYYVHADHLASPRAVTRPSDNAVMWRWDNAEPFGNNPPDENPGGLGAFTYNLRFPGQYYDAEIGTNYNYYRDYDPAVGRYTQSDPIGLAGGANTYNYVRADPVRGIDPLGWAPITWPFPGWQNFPPGRCTWDRYRQLRDDKDEACGKKYTCRDAKTCEELYQRFRNGLDCLWARKKIADECFEGGTFAHVAYQIEVIGVMRECQTRAKELGCCG